MSKFPTNETKTLETDVRRLEFISSWFEDIILGECMEFEKEKQSRPEWTHVVFPRFEKGFLKHLFDFRKANLEMCNMILVLLAARAR